MRELNYEKIITGGLRFLATQQQKSGLFPTLSSTKQNDFCAAKEYQMAFFSMLIFSCLNGVGKNAQTDELRKKLAQFLLSQKSPYWSFNYWARNSKQSQDFPYPDDLDDTFCALSALWEYDSSLLAGDALVKAVSLLAAMEQKEGGPYRTWLVQKNAGKEWTDIDLAVNSNVAYFLSLQDVSLENIEALVQTAIKKQQFTSPYYTSPLAVAYFISRFYRGKDAGKITEFVLRKRGKNGTWGNPLETALAVLTLLNLEYPSQKLLVSLKYLVQKQTKGSWLASAFCIDPPVDGKVHYAGSKALTTAFCLAAVAKFQQAQKKTEIVGKKIHQEKKVYDEILCRLKKRFSSCDGAMQKNFTKMLNAVLQNEDKVHVALLPYFFREMLQGKNEIDDEVVVQLGMANVYGWVAYTIYDDFYDDEGVALMLPVANICYGEMVRIFSQIKIVGFDKFFSKVLDDMEKANSWEMQNCRAKVAGGKLSLPQKIPVYKNYAKLADRSLGHALGPVALLILSGYSEQSNEVQDIWKFFQHYIIARQFNDDAHDWQEDLKKGHLNSVVTMLLKSTDFKSGQDTMELAKVLPRLEHLFWHVAVADVFRKISWHCKRAKWHLLQNSALADKEFLLDLVAQMEGLAQQTIKEQQEVLAFWEAYKKEGKHI